MEVNTISSEFVVTVTKSNVFTLWNGDTQSLSEDQKNDNWSFRVYLANLPSRIYLTNHQEDLLADIKSTTLNVNGYPPINLKKSHFLSTKHVFEFNGKHYYLRNDSPDILVIDVEKDKVVALFEKTTLTLRKTAKLKLDVSEKASIEEKITFIIVTFLAIKIHLGKSNKGVRSNRIQSFGTADQGLGASDAGGLVPYFIPNFK